ncbi:MAG: DUF1360 domain-containing protein [Burkholderiales bacterium]|nr:DUF1360 domain-containing protein [Burkholderiales bacterium]
MILEDLGFWPRLALAVLAAWRITHLLAAEDGPFGLVLKLRQWLGNGAWGQLMDCPYCVSLWVALPLAALLATDPLGWSLSVLALSGGVCIIEAGLDAAASHRKEN